jgi:hypothetical protein
MSGRLVASLSSWFLAIVSAAAFCCLDPDSVSQTSNQYALLRKPTVSAKQIAFSYGGDLWIVVCLVRTKRSLVVGFNKAFLRDRSVSL